MKAKRILSLLLTVAMMLTCVTAFAAPEGYDDYVLVSTTNTNGVTNDLIYGTLPNEASIRADIVATEYTDEDFYADYELTPSEYAAELGMTLPEGWTTWDGSAYLVSVSLYDLGTLVSKVTKSGKNYKNSGFKVSAINIDFEASDDVFIIERWDGELDTKNDASTEHKYFYQYNSTTATGGFPAGSTDATLDVTKENASVEDALVLLVFAKAGSGIDITKAEVVYTNHKDSTASVDINGDALKSACFALWTPATVTVGEGKQEEEKVVEIGTVSGATEAGAAVKPQYGTHKYDNAYVVTVNLTNEKNGDVVGVEFIPTEVLKYAGITETSTEDEINAVWATSAAKTTFGAVLGEGKAEYKAALINIPSFLAGTEFEIQARAFKTVGEDTTYAGAVKQKITYTVTAEPDRD